LGLFFVDNTPDWDFNIHSLVNFSGLHNMNIEDQKKASTGEETLAQDWHPADIVAALHKAGWTLASLAEHHGLKSGGTLSKALRFSFPIAEKRIADALGVHPKAIWPSRYHDTGERKLQGFHAIQSTRRTGRVNGQDRVDNRHETN
jgi:Ner family transcriptional regulator